MIYIILLLAPSIAILTRKHFIEVHVFFMVLIVFVLPSISTGNYNAYWDWEQISFLFVLAWISGSLIALRLLMKEDKRVKEE